MRTAETLQLAFEQSAAHGMLLTIVTAMSAGIMLIVIARKFGVPAIVLLLAGGVALGPAVWDGLIGIPAPVHPDGLGDGLNVIVSLSIGLILFEGGLTLDVSGYRSAPKVIKRLLVIGVLTTLFGAAAALKFILGIDWQTAIICGSLVIVTGPTVIAPLLKRINVKQKLHSILHWEAVLIDPIGVFIALLCYEMVVEESGDFTVAFTNFGYRIGFGLLTGFVGGYVLTYLVKKRFVVDEMVNVFALGVAVLMFGVAEWVQPEAGLLAVTVGGFVFGITNKTRIKEIKQFKAEITDLLIGVLFILLAARLEFSQFAEFGWMGLLVIACLMLIVRPLGVFLSSFRTELDTREKMFLGWVAPRGIVAASMASLIALNLGDRFVETFTYSVIISTIVVQGSTAGLLARALGLQREAPTGWLLVGAHAFSRRLANFLKYKGDRRVLLVDSSDRAVRETRSQGLDAITADARDIAFAERADFQGIGNVLAITDNEDLNVRICQNWAAVVGEEHVFRCDPTVADARPEEDDDDAPPGRVVWPGMAKPSLLSTELGRGEAEFVEAEGEKPAGAPSAFPVANISKGGVRVVIDEDAAAEAPLEGKTLYLVRKADYLLRAVRPELILDLEPPADLRTLFETVIEHLVGVYPKLPRDQTVQELLDRESAFPTLLGNHVAVPHAFSAGVSTRICAVARIADRMPFGSRENDQVDLVFLLISPQGDPEGHLATLAEIARVLIRPEVKDRIMDARSPLEVLRVLRENVRN